MQVLEEKRTVCGVNRQIQATNSNPFPIFLLLHLGWRKESFLFLVDSFIQMPETTRPRFSCIVLSSSSDLSNFFGGTEECVIIFFHQFLAEDLSSLFFVSSCCFTVKSLQKQSLLSSSSSALYHLSKFSVSNSTSLLLKQNSARKPLSNRWVNPFHGKNRTSRLQEKPFDVTKCGNRRIWKDMSTLFLTTLLLKFLLHQRWDDKQGIRDFDLSLVCTVSLLCQLSV